VAVINAGIELALQPETISFQKFTLYSISLSIFFAYQRIGSTATGSAR
jgi:hypothetical protein